MPPIDAPRGRTPRAAFRPRIQHRHANHPRAARLGLTLATLWCVTGQAAEMQLLPEVSVTASREARPLAETAAAVGAVHQDALRLTRPTHPAQAVSQVPGAAVAVTNGEGHTTAIRQPFTTAPVYLFLEDGIPIRSTGFFNHNALYEVNLPQAGGLEIHRGPGSALYGSDAIGGVINVLTRQPPAERELSLSGEAGSFGWRRLLASGGASSASGSDGWRGDLNLTTTDGWRRRTAYDRQSATLRWDHALAGDASLKTVLGASRIDQETGANSPLTRADYQDNPTRNLRAIAYREVAALRLSTAYEREDGDTLISLTPYVRDNRMELLASFTLPNDPTVATTENRSYGLLAKWRRELPALRARLIAGVDLDVSPGSRSERRLNLTTTGSGANTDFTAYTVGGLAYDYDVRFRGISPYLHAEAAASERLRLSAGLRYDHLSYRFDNRLAAGANAVASTRNGTAQTTFYGQAADTTVDFDHASPKFGATFALSPDAHLFAAWTHGFRAPAEGQLFRPSSATSALAAQAAAASALGLKPVKADQREAGVRGRRAALRYELTVYDLVKRDDIISFRDPATNATQVVNAGKTTHRGIELGAGLPLGERWQLDAAFAYAEHRYADWVVPAGPNLSGKEIESAPRTISNTRLSYVPRPGARVQLEWLALGSYWLDAANTGKYAGHDLLNLRSEWPLGADLTLFANVLNLADKRYADSAQISSNTPVFAPGLPRTWYAGLEARW